MRKSLRLLLGVLVLLPVIAVMLAAGRATNANATVERPPVTVAQNSTGAVVKIIAVQTTGEYFPLASTTPPTTRYRWVRLWLKGFNFTRQTLTLQCKLDKAAWARCGASNGSGNVVIAARTTLKGLAPGLHTIRVRLVDPAGNAPPPITRYPYGDTQVIAAKAVFSWFVTSR